MFSFKKNILVGASLFVFGFCSQVLGHAIENSTAAEHRWSSEVSVISVVQRVQRPFLDSSRMETNTRADFSVGYQINSRHRFQSQLRLSDGNGLSFGSLSSSNAIVPGDEDDFDKPILLQAYYTYSGLSSAIFAIGQMDPYAFFDANEYSDDEGDTFLNLAFIHNPLLDVGGDLNPGTYGGTPGVHVMFGDSDQNAYTVTRLAIFGSGLGADLKGSMRNRVSVGQFEYAHSQTSEYKGHYRIYVWDRNNGVDVDGISPMSAASGWGISLNQGLSEYIGIFSRFGKSTDDVKAETLEDAVTGGMHVGGALWGRANDSFGVALGSMKINQGDSESFSEIYYKLKLTPNFSITPSFQAIEMIDQKNIEIFSVRIKMAL